MGFERGSLWVRLHSTDHDANDLHLPPKQCDQKKSPNVYKSCPEMISLEKWQILTPLQKLPKNVGDLGKLIVAKVFKKLPKVQ